MLLKSFLILFLFLSKQLYTHRLYDYKHSDAHPEQHWSIPIIRTNFTEPIYGKKYKYYVSDKGYWFVDPCSIIGDDKHGLIGTFKDLYDDSLSISKNRRSLTPHLPGQLSKWPNGIIPVDITSGYPSTFDRELFNEMVAEYKKTGITIVERTNEKDYILVISDGGCYSVVGKSQIGGGQVLSMGDEWCMTLATFVHEIGHALGLLHTHSRYDRDKYIKINYDNIREQHHRLFIIREYPVCGCYDCTSVMHYSPWQGSNGNGPTMTAIDKDKCVIKRNAFNPLSSQDIVCIKYLYFNEKNMVCDDDDDDDDDDDTTTSLVTTTTAVVKTTTMIPTLSPILLSGYINLLTKNNIVIFNNNQFIMKKYMKIEYNFRINQFPVNSITLFEMGTHIDPLNKIYGDMMQPKVIFSTWMFLCLSGNAVNNRRTVRCYYKKATEFILNKLYHIKIHFMDNNGITKYLVYIDDIQILPEMNVASFSDSIGNLMSISDKDYSNINTDGKYIQLYNFKIDGCQTLCPEM